MWRKRRLPHGVVARVIVVQREPLIKPQPRVVITYEVISDLLWVRQVLAPLTLKTGNVLLAGGQQ